LIFQQVRDNKNQQIGSDDLLDPKWLGSYGLDGMLVYQKLYTCMPVEFLSTRNDICRTSWLVEI
jgi:hypothetical protein